MTSHQRRWLLLGVAAWLVQPLYIASEFLVARTVRSPYSFLHDTISELGIRGCRMPGAFDDVCSPDANTMNWSFVLFGLAVSVGAVLLAPHLLRTRAARTAIALWFVSGLASVGVGVVSLDVSEGLHALVATPVFLARPLALLLIARALWSARPWLARSTLVAGAISVFGAVAFGSVLGDERWVGLFERLALWPSDIWFAVAALALVRASSPPPVHGT